MREITSLDIVIRLAVAMLAGLAVGGQRARTYHPAGLRTHMLVALGACSVMMTGDLLSNEIYQAYGTVPDPARIGAQVVSGIGFLGAGTIIKAGSSIRGLTTAASLWAVACIALAAGAGYELLALLGTTAVYITLTCFGALQKIMRSWRGSELLVRLECEQVADILVEIHRQAAESGAMVMDLSFDRTPHHTYKISFRIGFPGKEWKEAQSQFTQVLAVMPGIVSLKNERD